MHADLLPPTYAGPSSGDRHLSERQPGLGSSGLRLVQGPRRRSLPERAASRYLCAPIARRRPGAARPRRGCPLVERVRGRRWRPRGATARLRAARRLRARTRLPAPPRRAHARREPGLLALRGPRRADHSHGVVPEPQRGARRLLALGVELLVHELVGAHVVLAPYRSDLPAVEGA